MPETNPLNYQVAVRDFQQARRQAAMQQILARVTGKSAELLCYEEVRRQLRVEKMVARGLQEVPLAAIVGSVGRYQDFTRSFLPKKDSNEARWAGVKAAVMDMKGMGPIEVYKVGEAYFVKDGNHRVSVARQLGTETISAYVTEVETRVPLTAADDAGELICKARYARFLERTDLDKLRPSADLTMSFCGQYDVLLQQIEVNQVLLAQAQGQAVAWAEAVSHWYDAVYLPVVQLIREQGVLHEFPERTETDLYILLSEYRSELTVALGWQVDTETAVTQLAPRKSKRPRRVMARVGERLRGAVTPMELETGPAPGQWRKERLSVRQCECLFQDILVAIRPAADWRALSQAVAVARRENGRVHGLHIPTDEMPQDVLREEFFERVKGVKADLALERGNPAKVIVKRAAWTDLVVLPLNHPPGERPLTRLSSGFNALVQRCPRPILAVPHYFSPLDNALLAYDGSPKSDEALFVAAYLASRWQTALTVLTVETNHTSPEALQQARAYLEQHNVSQVQYILRSRPIAQAVLETAATHRSNLLIMGGFGYRPMMHLMLGSTVDHVLRAFKYPVLICR